MRAEEKEKKNLAIQEFRYGVVAELANPFLTSEQKKEMIREKARRIQNSPLSPPFGSCRKREKLHLTFPLQVYRGW
jgi:hypothetical protein